jgi:WD repeat-containing protein 40A
MSKRLPHTMEVVCLATDEEGQMYAVGSKANTDLLDARTLQAIKKIPSRSGGCGIRSVSFKGNIVTIGTGAGRLLFYDVRASRFLEPTGNGDRAVTLKASRGWVVSSAHSNR